MYPRKNTTLLRFGLTATRPTRLRTRPQRRTPGPNIKHVGHRAVELCPREPGGRGGSHFKSSYHPPSPPPLSPYAFESVRASSSRISCSDLYDVCLIRRGRGIFWPFFFFFTGSRYGFIATFQVWQLSGSSFRLSLQKKTRSAENSVRFHEI